MSSLFVRLCCSLVGPHRVGLCCIRFVEKVDICSMMYMSVSELLVAGLEDGSMAFWNPDSKRYRRMALID